MNMNDSPHQSQYESPLCIFFVIVIIDKFGSSVLDFEYFANWCDSRSYQVFDEKGLESLSNEVAGR